MNLIPSLVRTYVPLIVGYLVGWLSTLGITVTDDQKAALVGGIGTVAAALYYLLARILETKVPALTWLLGSPVQPVAYQPESRPDVILPVRVAPTQTATVNVPSPADVAVDDTPGKHEAPAVPPTV